MPGSVNPGTVPGDTATQIPKTTRAGATMRESRTPRGNTFSAKITGGHDQQGLPPVAREFGPSPRALRAWVGSESGARSNQACPTFLGCSRET
jgi:hypothetical protein